MKCIDVYNGQGVISLEKWKKIKKVAPYCIIRSSYTRLASPFRMEVDASFERNIKNAYKAGMKIGIYHFSQATSESEGIAEGNFTLKTIKPYKKYITLPVAMDYEFGKRHCASEAKKKGKTGTLKVIDAYCHVIKNAGFEPMVYSSLNEFNNYISTKVSSKYKIWVAQYHNECQYKYPHYMWQYTSSEKIPGVRFDTSGVDMSYIYLKDEPDAKKSAYKGVWPILPKRGWFQNGDRGGHVKNLQKLLNWLVNAGLIVDGVCGSLTVEAIKDFQRQYGLKVDGGFGSKCLAKAKEVRK